MTQDFPENLLFGKLFEKEVRALLPEGASDVSEPEEGIEAPHFDFILPGKWAIECKSDRASGPHEASECRKKRDASCSHEGSGNVAIELLSANLRSENAHGPAQLGVLSVLLEEAELGHPVWVLYKVWNPLTENWHYLAFLGNPMADYLMKKLKNREDDTARFQQSGKQYDKEGNPEERYTFMALVKVASLLSERGVVLHSAELEPLIKIITGVKDTFRKWQPRDLLLWTLKVNNYYANMSWDLENWRAPARGANASWLKQTPAEVRKPLEGDENYSWEM